MEKIRFVLVNDDYIQYLKSIDLKVQDNYAEQNIQKPYIYGVEVECNGKKFLIPLTSPYDENNEVKVKFKGEKFEKCYKKFTIKLIKEFPNSKKARKPEFLGALLVNNMIPLLEEEIMDLNFSRVDKEYRILLDKEYKILVKPEMKEKVREMANNIYNYVANGESFFTKYCCDFKALEVAADNYRKNKQNQTN